MYIPEYKTVIRLLCYAESAVWSEGIASTLKALLSKYKLIILICNDLNSMNEYLQSRSISMLAWRIWLNAALPLGLGMLGNPEVITQGLETRHKSRAAHSWEGIPGKNAKVKSLKFVTKDTC